jgi:hypothetical protein
MTSQLPPPGAPVPPQGTPPAALPGAPAPPGPPDVGNGPQYPYPPYPPPRRTNTMAILALIFGLLFAPVGIILGHLSRKQIRENGEEGDTLALVGLIIGYIQTGVMVAFCLGYAALVVLVVGTIGLSGR